MPEMTREDLKTMQNWPLERKIQVSQTRIIEWIQSHANEGGTNVSFSGGKDSTVLLDLVRRVDPAVPAVFSDTGLEYSEIRNFVKTIPNVTWIKPKKNFFDVISEYGYPIIGKETSKFIEMARRVSPPPPYAIRALSGENLDGTPSEFRKNHYGKWKFLLDAPFKISDKCCYWLKESPLSDYQKNTKSAPFIGLLATESARRTQGWLKTGCNNYKKGSAHTSKPLAFWTEQDILTYIQRFSIPYAKEVYGDIITVPIKGKKGQAKLQCTGLSRTGCSFCLYGAHCKGDRRLLYLKEYDIKRYNYCMNGGEFNENGMWVPNKEGLGYKYIIDNWLPQIKY